MQDPGWTDQAKKGTGVRQPKNTTLLQSCAKSRFRFLKDMDELPVYTRSQLALRNGQDRPEVWIAYKGLIYDVSRSRLWMRGWHYEHWAGQDLTHELADAPHDEWVFQNFDPIGRLA